MALITVFSTRMSQLILLYIGEASVFHPVPINNILLIRNGAIMYVIYCDVHQIDKLSGKRVETLDKKNYNT
jgi:hypothetical protein